MDREGLTLALYVYVYLGKDFKELALEIFDILPDGEISLEVVSTDANSMVGEARTLLTWAPEVCPACTPCSCHT